MKIVFLDEYSVAGRDLTTIKTLGDYTAYENTAKSEVVERLQGADIAITNKVMIDAEAMRALPSLKLICVAATGMNNVDLNAAEAVEFYKETGFKYLDFSFYHAVTRPDHPLMKEGWKEWVLAAKKAAAE